MKTPTGKTEGFRKHISAFLTSRLIRLLSRTPLTPNMITWLGFILTLAAAALIITGDLLIAGIVVIGAGFLDMLDGALARLTNRVTTFGGVLDSALDRLSEAALLLGLLVFFASQGDTAASFLAGLTLTGSFMVSYLRARCEGAGIECRIGLFTRAERIIFLSLGLLFSSLSPYSVIVAMTAIAVLSFITVGQRLFHAYRQTGGN